MYGGFAYGARPYGGLSSQPDDRQAVEARWVAAIRFTVGGVSYAVASDDVILNGVEHEGRLIDEDSLNPQSYMPEEFGLASPSSPSATIVDDENHTYRAILDASDLDYMEVLVEIVTYLTLEDGNERTISFKRKHSLEQASVEQGQIRLELQGLEDDKLDQEYPFNRFTADHFSGIHEEHEGKTIPEVFGLGIKCPGVYLDSSGPWQIGFCLSGPALVKASGTQDGVLTIYRDSRIVDSSEYTLKDVSNTGATFSVLVAEFTQEQLRPDGSLYEFSADIRDSGTTRSSNPVDEIAHLMSQGSMTLDTVFKDNAKSYIDTIGIEVGGVLGREGTLTLRSILDSLSVPARTGLVRSADGSYKVLQHRPLTNVRASYDEDAMQLVALENWSRKARAASVAVRYGTSPRDPSKLKHEVRRPVTDGAAGDKKAWDLPYVQDFDSADKVAAFMEKREQYNRIAEVRVGLANHTPMEVLSLRSEPAFSGARLIRILSAEQIPAGSAFTAQEYREDIFDYIASTPPSNASTTYEPDYSHTPPEAPTGLQVDDAGTFVAEDGTVRAFLDLSAVEPSANFQFLQFQLKNTNDNTIVRLDAEDANDDGRWDAQFTNLNPNVTYEWHVYAVNPANVGIARKGIVASQNVNTAQAAVPGTPTGLSATAKSGRTELTWTNPTDDDFDEIEIHRSTTNGFTPDASTLIAEEKGEKHNDITGTPGTLYYYKVVAVSTSELSSSASSQASATFQGVTGEGVSKDAPASMASIGISIGSSETYQDAEGGNAARVRVDLSSIPTDAQRAYIQIRHRKSGTSNYRLDDQVEPGSGSVSVWIDDLLPNVEYVFSAEPISHFGIPGTDATVTATAPKDTTAPSAPTGLSATQGSARQISVAWSENSENDILDYELQMKIGGGSFFTTYQGRATGKTIRLSSYAQHTFRVRARDTSKNNSGWSSEVSETPDKNIDYRDIPSGGVRRDSVDTDAIDTDRRDGVGIVSVSTGSSSSPGVSKGSGSISSPKTPLTSMKGIYVGTKVGCDEMHSITAASTSSVSVWNMGLDCRNGMSIDVFYF